MRAPEVWLAMVDDMHADAVIQSIIGPAITLTDSERGFRVPSITGTLLGATQGERWVQVTFQVDVFCKSLTDAVQVGDALLGLFDKSDTRTTVGHLRAWSRCVDERELHGPVADGVYRRSLDFEVEVIRRRYRRMAAES